MKCFSVPLLPPEIKVLKNFMQDKFPQGVNEKGLTLHGFLFLMTHFIEKARIRKLWIILKAFGYNNDIKLSDDLIPYSSFKRDVDQVKSTSCNYGTHFVLALLLIIYVLLFLTRQ